MHNPLIFQGTVFQVTVWRISAVESHEEISQLVISEFVTVIIVHILGYSIVYIKQCSRYAGCACNDIFAQCPIYVHFARYRNTPGSQPGIDIARHKAKLRLECRPAFVSKCGILRCSNVLFHPIQQCYLILCQFGKNTRKLLPSPNSFSISFTTDGILGSFSCRLKDSNKSNSEFSIISTPKSNNGFMGALHAKIIGPWPKAENLEF